MWNRLAKLNGEFKNIKKAKKEAKKMSESVINQMYIYCKVLIYVKLLLEQDKFIIFKDV